MYRFDATIRCRIRLKVSTEAAGGARPVGQSGARRAEQCGEPRAPRDPRPVEHEAARVPALTHRYARSPRAALRAARRQPPRRPPGRLRPVRAHVILVREASTTRHGTNAVLLYLRRLPVRELYLQHNSLKKLPETLGSMSALEVLDVSNNALTDLPESVGALDSLRVLRARDNRLSRLPRCALSPHSADTALHCPDAYCAPPLTRNLRRTSSDAMRCAGRCTA